MKYIYYTEAKPLPKPDSYEATGTDSLIAGLHVRKSQTIVSDITIPVRMKITLAGEEMHIEFHWPGIYTINLKLHL